jgi:hypothetical protein
MDFSLEYYRGFLCVLVDKRARIVTAAGPVRIRKWFPIREAAEEEIVGLVGRRLMLGDECEGLYVDECGEAFSLIDGKDTEALEVEIVRSGNQNGWHGNGAVQAASAAEGHGNGKLLLSYGGDSETSAAKDSSVDAVESITTELGVDREPFMSGATPPVGQLSLKEKLVEIRRRIGQVEKRGINEAGNYRYVRAADLAGPIGDLLAEYGIILLPRLESINSDPLGNRAGLEERTHVVVAYTFVDAKTSEELTVKLAGTGMDPGDKAVAKAQTSALKYALLQTFLIATGDDPEEECGKPASGKNATTPNHNGQRITVAQAAEIKQLVERTGTELERMLEYFHVASIEGMNERSYSRALTTLRKKLDKANARESHATETQAAV